jgi:hypothetical protein
VNKPTKKYEEIYKTFETEDPNKSPEEDLKRSDSSMKNELQNYLKELSQNTAIVPAIASSKENNIPEAIMSFSDNFTNSYQTI